MGGNYSQAPYGDFWTDYGTKHVDQKMVKQTLKIPAAGQPICFCEMMSIKKDAHRHDSNLHGPVNSPSSIWSPIVEQKKRVLTQSAVTTRSYQT